MKSLYVLIAVLVAAAVGVYYFWGNPAVPGGSQDISSNTTATMKLTSSAFTQGSSIPQQYTCDGDNNVNPPLTIADVPEGTKSLALIMDDPDVPKALRPDGVFDHWVLFNMPPTTTSIPEGGSIVGNMGANGAGQNTYTGPCPPTEYEPSTHRYFFTLYALDSTLALESGASKKEVLDAMEGHILEQAQLMGTYSRKE